MSQINKQILDIANLFIEKVRSNNVIIDSAYIFGSFARGDARHDSDLDIAIVSPQFGLNSFDEQLFLSRMDLNPNSPIEPHAFSPQDMNEKYNFLAQEVKKGIKII